MTSLYEPLSFVLVRAPALPVDVYLSLSANEKDEGSSASQLVGRITFVRRALATGSPSLARAVDRMRQEKCDNRAAANLRKTPALLIRCRLVRHHSASSRA
jgi:hypothetical protein